MAVIAKKQFIKDMRPNQPVQDVFLIQEAQLRQARNGPYWHLKIQDATGNLDGKIWSPFSSEYTLAPGMFVGIEGKIDLYHEQRDLKISKLRVLTEEEIKGLERADFLHCSEQDPEDMYASLVRLVRQKIVHRPLQKLIIAILLDRDVHAALLVSYGAKRLHHAFQGGLLQHTLAVARLVLAIAEQYPFLDQQILLAGAICHDLGKLREITVSGIMADYTDAGQLLGHVQLGMELLDSFLRTHELEENFALHLRHLVLSHHGLLEYGSPKVPMTAEAFVLHFADNIDAKLAQVTEAAREGGVTPGGWLPYQKFLERPLYIAPLLPGEEKVEQKPEGRESQCSLLSKG